MDKEFKSDALKANLDETKDQVRAMSEKDQWFLSLSASHWGIHQRTEEFMIEYNHKLVNYDYLLDHLHKMCLTDLWFYRQLEASEEALLFFIRIFRDLFERDLKDKDKAQVVKTFFKYIDRLLKEGQVPTSVLQSFLDLLEAQMKEDIGVFLANASYFKTYLPRLARLVDYEERVSRLTRIILLEGLDYWEKTSRVEDWLASASPAFQDKYKEAVQQIGKPFFDQLRSRIQASTDWEALVSNLFVSDIASHFRYFARSFDTTIDTIHYLFYLLHLEGMRHLSNHILYDMNRLLRDALYDLDHDRRFSFIEEILDLFKEFKDSHAGIILDCILTLGKEIVAIDDRKLISSFNKELIAFGFVAPGDVSITYDWQTRISTNHVKNIRVWLELIGSSPDNFKKLLAALVVNLRLGGIFISDTDLFQRDVTQLLNTDIKPVYKQIKQLARYFPVYFNEIGAEGTLRDVTTSMDEMEKRKDRLIHFLRKQIHAESNNTHILLVEKIAHYWYDGKRENLKDLVPQDVYQALAKDQRYFKDLHTLMVEACQSFKVGPQGLLSLPAEQVMGYIEGHPLKAVKAKKKFNFLIELDNLLREKYSLETHNLARILKDSRFFTPEDIEDLLGLMAAGKDKESLGQLFILMDQLKGVILDPGKTQAVESIYYKRHIAIGIPSMYGRYSEPKFEALGLMYRLERVASKLMSDLVADLKMDYVTARTLQNMCDLLHLFRDGLMLDGMVNQNFNSNLEMFRYSLKSASFTLGQYLNIFRFMSLNIKEMIHEYFIRFYDASLNAVVPQLFGGGEEEVLRRSETFYRETLSSAFLIQELDGFVASAMDKLQIVLENYSESYILNMLTYNPDLTVSPFTQQMDQVDNRVFLGAKAYYLKKLKSYDFPIPEGFVLTTELFRHRETVFDHPYMSLELEEEILRQIGHMEEKTGKSFANSDRPMLLSVRSGTAISMPGAMTTILNVGISEKTVHTLAKDPDQAWMAWDAYRRYLQSWGMNKGLERPIFDELMKKAKEKYGVKKKADFSAGQIEYLAKEYKKTLLGAGIEIHEDPLTQLRQAILTVLESWNSPRAKSYREHLQIADEWGTAVIIQEMVMGNRTKGSGSGVVFTHNPKLNKPGINLYGDFTLCSQGEDIVAGLVHTLPISESQRKEDYPHSNKSLQSAFPDIYEALKQLAYRLINQYGYANQEIEFTFESPDPADLYILQTREQIISKKERTPVFDLPADKRTLLGRGIGIDGGCLSGRVCIDMADLIQSKVDYPQEGTILLRPDTIPDDIPKIFKCDGLVTSRGGVTSHSAVTASKLGKVCVVNCKALAVDDDKKTATIQGKKLFPGDLISIDGNSGNIYKGAYPIIYVS